MAIKCGKCNRTISRYETYIACTISCHSNYHLTCVGLDDESLDKLQQDGKLSSWSCSFCEISKTSMPLGAAYQSDIPFSQNVNLPVAGFMRLIEDVIKTHAKPLADQIGELTTEIQILSKENSQLRTEVIKLQKNLQPRNLLRKELSQDEINAKT